MKSDNTLNYVNLPFTQTGNQTDNTFLNHNDNATRL